MPSTDRPSRNAIAFAFVADAYTRTNDALRGLAPLFESAISKRAGSLFDAATIAQEINDQLDLTVSPLVIEGLVPALESEGLLKKIVSTTQEAVYRCVGRPRDENAASVEHDIEQIFEDFRAYAHQHLSSHKIDVSDQTCDDKLLEVISTTDFLHVALRNDPSRFRGRTLSLKKEEETVDLDYAKAQALDVIAAKYVDECREKDINRFNLLAHAAWGALISEVVLSLQRPAPQSDLSNLTVFLDGPLILDLLDIGSEEGHTYATDLFALLRRSGVRLATYSHLITEMIGAITTPLKLLDHGQYASGPLVRRIKSEPSHLTYVRTVLSNLSKRVTDQGIEIIDDLNFETPDLIELFDDKEIDKLRNAIGAAHFNVDRRDRDARSVAYAMRSRRGFSSVTVSDCRAIFVTRNAVLAKEAQRQLERSGKFPAFSAPVCLTDRQLAGVLWFCCGGGGEQSLTRLKLVTNCAMAVVPRNDLVSQVAQHLFDTKPERMPEFEALLNDKRASMCLVGETLGVASLANADDVERILDKMRQELTIKAREDFDQEMKNVLEKQAEIHSIQIEEKTSKIESLISRIDQDAEDRRRSEQEIREETLRLQEQQQSLTSRIHAAEGENIRIRKEVNAGELARRERISALSNLIARAIEVLVGLAIFYGVYWIIDASLKGKSLNSLGIMPSWTAIAATALLAVFTWFGWSRSSLRNWVHQRVFTFLKQAFGF